jgi:hypothetical protein
VPELRGQEIDALLSSIKSWAESSLALMNALQAVAADASLTSALQAASAPETWATTTAQQYWKSADTLAELVGGLLEQGAPGDAELLKLIHEVRSAGHGLGVLSDLPSESTGMVKASLKQVELAGLSAKDIVILILAALLLLRIVHGADSAVQVAVTGDDLQVASVLIALAALLRKS